MRILELCRREREGRPALGLALDSPSPAELLEVGQVAEGL